MAFPTSVQAFTTKQNGVDYPQATDINTLQTEVNAIEDGYLNATARLNSSNSTAANLSVTGGSTLANLSVTGGSTFAGPVTFSSGVTFSTTANVYVPSVRCQHSAKSEVANTAWTGLNWDTEDFDVTGMHSTSVNSSRITFVDSTGIYAVGAHVEWNAGSTVANRMLRIKFNGSSAVAANSARAWNDPNQSFPLSVSGILRVASTTDYITAEVYQDSGSTHSIIALSTTYGNSFYAYKVSAK